MKKLVSVGLLSHMPANKPRLVRVDDRRLACVRRGARVDVIDDRCPHEGKPLSMGHVREGVLTCPWHNWKFDLEDGRCLFGGEAVRRYPAEVHGGEVFVDLALDVGHARARLEEDLVRAVAEGSVDGAVREALRLERLAPGEPYGVLVRMACERTAQGGGDALVAIEAALALAAAGLCDDAEALAIAIQAVADETHGRAPRARPEPVVGTLADRDAFLEDLLEERRTMAAARALGLDATVEELADAWLVPFASLKVWDGGHTLSRVRAAAALSARLGAETAAAVRVGLATSCAWAVAESDLPAWRATRTALREAARVEPGTAALAGALDLATERDAVEGTLAALRAGAAPVALLEHLAGAALDRLARYDVTRSMRAGSAISAWTAAAAVIFAEATLRQRCAERLAGAHAILLAGLVGKLTRLVGSLGAEPPPLAELTREAALAPRCGWSSRGRAATLAVACFRLSTRLPSHATMAAHALRRGALEDVGGGLARLAATAARLVDGGETDE